ncbi:MAG: prenyltransferase, partial [Marmoricola sp.]
MPEAFSWQVPAVDGVLTSGQVADTAASIAAMQEPSGAVPWTPGEKTDVWNHVEGAMAMLVGGQVEAAERAYAWCAATQRADGSWP